MTYLAETDYLDFSSAPIQACIAEFKHDDLSDKAKAIGLYTKVRDNWRYDPYNFNLSKEHFKASHIAQQTSGNCVHKSIVLVAGLRGLGIPARLHLGKVKNHIAVERLTEKFGSNELTPHGMVNVFLNNQWLKMSPAFNASLCERLNVKPLNFDGENSSYLQQYDSSGTRFMEYIDDYGYFDDVPYEFMLNNLKENYPKIFDTGDDVTEFRL